MIKTDKSMISVLLPVYNAEESVERAIVSILRQSHREFELLVINDGSRDRSLKIIQTIDDARMRVIDLKENRGLIGVLNLGLELAKGEIIVRQDADDESVSNRIELQLEVLLREPGVVAVGSALQIMREGRWSGEVWSYPGSAVEARWQSLFKTPVAHSAVAYRRRLVIELGGYSEKFRYAEDYELWSRLVTVGEIRSVKEALVKYDLGSGGVSRAKSEEQRLVHCRIARHNMERLLNRKVEGGVVESLASGIDRGGIFREFDEYRSAIECLTNLYKTFVVVESQRSAGSDLSLINRDFEERIWKLVKMLPYRMRLRGVRAFQELSPGMNLSLASVVRALCRP